MVYDYVLYIYIVTVSVKCVALEILAFKTTVTLKIGSGVTQGHRK